MVDLPEEFKEKMRAQLGEKYTDFLKSYELPPQKAIRVNTLKISTQNFTKITPFALSPTPWEPSGFFVDAEGLGKTVLHAAGAYYVQEPSAMSAVPELEVKPGECVLDLCSAPGGKGTQIAQYMQGEGVLVLNEINFSRAKILSQNVERLGIKNAVVTCASPEKLAKNFTSYFDKILIDAPCSGEGMFKKEQNAIPEWSLENVRLCAERQKSILNCASSMLKAGGRLVYSTCTFATEEDEEQVKSFISEHSDFCLVGMKKLYPHEIRGEGHFVAVFERTEGEQKKHKYASHIRPDKKQLSLFKDWLRENLFTEFSDLAVSDGVLYCPPQNMPETSVQILREGIRLGEFEGNRFVPSHSLAMCLNENEANCIKVDEDTALKYLRGLTFDCPPDFKGWYLVTYCSLPLGWCKAVNGTAKNHLPKGLRI